MTNIWGFLAQTITATVAAALLLAVKALLADKLSPRWQYGVWAVLAVRLLLPVSTARGVLLPIPLWVETWKSLAEQNLSSAYSAVYTPFSVRWPIPLWTARPESVTDWLFVIYGAGVAAVLLWYALSYLRLRLLLRRGNPVSPEIQAQIQTVCDTYHLRPCRVITAAGLPSAFVCGVVHPVLVLPEGTTPDDKVLLHELLHVKYFDALQGMLWCVLRALHWCNPVLLFIFRRIGNDMESLCDQRVLERLTGEDRRTYGSILLSMANDRYPRSFGTTSLSNGGKNIARRIAAIVRFKKYPKGMQLVSVCVAVAVVLALPLLSGTNRAYAADLYRPGNTGAALTQSLAMTRLQRCTTVAGALDTYAKGLMCQNGIYIAMAAPMSRQEAISGTLRQGGSYWLYSGAEMQNVEQYRGYLVYRLLEQQDGSYTALLAFSAAPLVDAANPGDILRNEDGTNADGCVVIPVRVWQENGWVVEETGPRSIIRDGYLDHLMLSDEVANGCYVGTHESERGTFSLQLSRQYAVSNTAADQSWTSFGQSSFDNTVKPNAAFSSYGGQLHAEYAFHQPESLTDCAYISMELVKLESLTDEPAFSERRPTCSGNWSNSDGNAGCSKNAKWDRDGALSLDSYFAGTLDPDHFKAPAGYAVRIYCDDVVVDEFVMEGVA
jgi:bla regulator protein BlaR1